MNVSSSPPTYYLLHSTFIYSVEFPILSHLQFEEAAKVMAMETGLLGTDPNAVPSIQVQVLSNEARKTQIRELDVRFNII